MKCPVCDKIHMSMVCPKCGFDSSRNYEKYPTLGPVGKVPSVSTLRQARIQQQPEPTEEHPVPSSEPLEDPVILPPAPEPTPAPAALSHRKPLIAIAVCAVMLLLGIGIGTRLGGTQVESTEPMDTMQTQEPAAIWDTNTLRPDHISYRYAPEDFPECSVFGSEYRRQEISSVTFLDTLADMPRDAWDVSVVNNRKVMAWVIPNGDLYDLYIGAEGGIWVREACEDLFAGYTNASSITLGDALHTDRVLNMSRMFIGCSSLTSLDLSSLDTSKVWGMSSMLQNCTSLTSLNLNGFNTANVQDMNHMFYGCVSLTELTLGDGFVTTNADTTDMFTDCPAGADYQHLLH